MYDEHAPLIAQAMRADLETFRRGLLFVELSIRQPIVNVPSMLADVDRNGRESAYLLGWKRAAYDQLQLEGRRLWRDVCAMPLERPADAMRAFLGVTGLGLVKAGFAAQLMGFDVACVDSRNAQREGTPLREFRVDKARMSAAAIDRRIDAYLQRTQGRAREYWDAWCAFVAPDYGRSAEEISAIHLAILPETEEIPF